jgi:hypothetical protein
MVSEAGGAVALKQPHPCAFGERLMKPLFVIVALIAPEDGRVPEKGRADP